MGPSARFAGIGGNASWALTANVAQGLQPVVVLLVLARWSTPETVGAYALAMAVLTPLVLVSRMQLRGVLVTDTSGRHALAEYLRLRLVTSSAVVLAAALIADFWASEGASLWLIGMALLRTVEGAGDVIYGAWQRQDRWSTIAVAVVARTVGCYGGLCALVIAGAPASLALAVAFFASLLVLFLYEAPRAPQPVLSRATAAAPILRLIRRAAPLGAAGALVALLPQIPRYAIEWSAGSEALGFFAALSYPFLAGSLFVQSAGQALLVRLAPVEKHLPPEYFRNLGRLLGLATGLGAAGLAVALLAARPVLRLLYGVEYAVYAPVLPAVAVSMAPMLLTMAMGFALTAMRVFAPQAWVFAFACTVCAVSSALLVPAWGLYGAACAAGLGWVSVAGLFAILLASRLWSYRSRGERARPMASVVASLR